MIAKTSGQRVIVVGGGFTGLAAAYVLSLAGIDVSVVEGDQEVGGLAGSFPVGDVRLEKFYHHWFTNDRHVMDLIEELGAGDQVLLRPTRTGMYHTNTFFRLSKPFDLLKFTPLSLVGRIRLGLLVLRARRVKDWRELEDLTAEQWLRRLCGDEVYRVVWEPLLRGKFGPYATQVSAVWFWNKLVLRGGSRGKHGEEVLAYFRGGFAALAERIAGAIRERGGEILTGVRATDLIVEQGRACGIHTERGELRGDAVIATPALPVVADLLQPHMPASYTDGLRRIEYLANVCLVLELDRSLSSTYWLNVNDADFPYVGVIEHTNFEPPATYGGRHIIYLSKYLPADSELYRMSDDQVFEFSLPHIQRMFPQFDRSWVFRYHAWRARYAQPIVGRRYSELIPEVRTPLDGLYLSTMAQIYPEDRGTNYAIREGRKVGALVAEALGNEALIESRGMATAPLDLP